MFHDPMTEYPYFLSFYNVTQEDPKHGQTVIVDVTSKILDQILLLSDIYFFVWEFLIWKSLKYTNYIPGSI